MSKGLTSAQRALFWRMFSRACMVQDMSSGSDREAYRKRLMAEECGVEHMADLNRTSDFDALLLRLLLDAEDYEQAAHYQIAGERRLAYLVEVCAAQVLLLKGGSETAAVEYILGIVRQAGYTATESDGAYWLDVSAPDLARVFQMLDTHRRRLLVAAGWQGSMSFSPDMSYQVDEHGRVETARRRDIQPVLRVA